MGKLLAVTAIFLVLAGSGFAGPNHPHVKPHGHSTIPVTVCSPYWNPGTAASYNWESNSWQHCKTVHKPFRPKPPKVESLKIEIDKNTLPFLLFFGLLNAAGNSGK